MAEYAVHEQPDRLTWHIQHKPTGALVSTIDAFQPSKGKPLLYQVNNQTKAANTPFSSLEDAIQHSLLVHQQSLKSPQEHPLQQVADLINDLGEALWTAADDPQLHHETDKIQDISKAHANLAQTFNRHYGKKK